MVYWGSLMQVLAAEPTWGELALLEVENSVISALYNVQCNCICTA